MIGECINPDVHIYLEGSCGPAVAAGKITVPGKETRWLVMTQGL